MLGLLTSLKTLRIQCVKYTERHAEYHDMSGKTVVLKLPHLASLQLRAFQQGQLVLSCPKLAVAHILKTKSLRIVVEDASLAEVELYRCEMIHFAMHEPEEQLKTLRSLKVRECTEVDKHLIENVGKMTRLQVLDYRNFSASRMPKSFPQKLEQIYLQSTFVGRLEFDFL